MPDPATCCIEQLFGLLRRRNMDTCWDLSTGNNCSGCWRQENPDPDPNNLPKNDPDHKPDPDQSPIISPITSPIVPRSLCLQELFGRTQEYPLQVNMLVFGFYATLLYQVWVFMGGYGCFHAFLCYLLEFL